jgi:hypothetical protein
MSNFSFLNDDCPYLASLGKEAEKTLYTNPVSALVYLRMFAEQLAKFILNEEDLSEPETPNLYEMLSLLDKHSKLPRKIKRSFHSIRDAGNAAVHEKSGTWISAAAQLESAYDIATWAYKQYIMAGFKRKPFALPLPPPGIDTPVYKPNLENAKIIPTIIGIDFSGSKEAGKHICITIASPGNGVLTINSCERLCDMPGGTQELDPSMAFLVSLIAKQSNALVGIDFPFSNPKSVIKENTWEKYVANYAAKFGDADSFRNTYSEFSMKLFGHPEVKRQTDKITKTPWCPWNLKLYKQTYNGISKVLFPLIRDDLARVLPMQMPAPKKSIVIEICPASTLKDLNLYNEYKGNKQVHKDNRKRLLEGLRERAVHIPIELGPMLIGDKDGDGIDSIVAAYAVWRNLSKLTSVDVDPIYKLEGMVYV